MEYKTTATLRPGFRTQHGFNQVLSIPIIVTDEHSRSSYGQPVIVCNDDTGDLIDYHEIESVEIPQDYSYTLLDGRMPNDYRPVVDFFRRLERFGVKLTGFIPGWYDCTGTESRSDAVVQE